jgi:hypothetical protein
MRKRKYILTNFLHGNSPYLRTIELALMVGKLLKNERGERCGVVVPLVYGERQKQIIFENFHKTIRNNPDKILFDRKLGEILKPLFYSGETSYEGALCYFFDHYREAQNVMQKYIQNGLSLEDFYGKEYSLQGNELLMEVNRCPQLHSGITPSYFTGFDYISEVLRHALHEDDISISKSVLQKNIPLYEEIESKQAAHFIAEPSIFSYKGNRPRKYPNELFTPPNTNQVKRALKSSFATSNIDEGIYVTITGVPGLERLFQEILDVGLRIYTHRTDLIPGSTKAPPSIVAHPNILYHFARSGWGSVWLSLYTMTPFITRSYTEHDDLEIYFNNISLESLGFGMVCRGESLDELHAFGAKYKENATSIQSQLLERYGTTDGIAYTARKIVNHFNK